jgi:DNA polymerase phi
MAVDEGEEDGEEEDEGDGEDDTEGVDDGDGEDADAEDDAELRRKLAGAFGANDGGSDADADEADEEMDDDQMMAIDEQLAAIFKEQTKGKRRGKYLVFMSR